MEGKVIYINEKIGNFALSTKKGKCTICNASNIKDVKFGDTIEFDNEHGGYYFHNSRTERFIASVVYLDININQCEYY